MLRRIYRKMSTSLSKLVNNLSEIYRKECKGCKERKKLGDLFI